MEQAVLQQNLFYGLTLCNSDEGVGGDDAADALRYLVATKPNEIHQVKLRGL